MEKLREKTEHKSSVREFGVYRFVNKKIMNRFLLLAAFLPLHVLVIPFLFLFLFVFLLPVGFSPLHSLIRHCACTFGLCRMSQEISALLQPSIHKRIFLLAFPMVLSNITVPLLGLVDAAVIGIYRTWYLGGVAGSTATVTCWVFTYGHNGDNRKRGAKMTQS